jgi:hypothetical protein
VALITLCVPTSTQSSGFVMVVANVSGVSKKCVDDKNPLTTT